MDLAWRAVFPFPHEDYDGPTLPKQRAERHLPPGGVQHRQLGYRCGQGLPALGAARDCGWGGAAADLPRNRGEGGLGHSALHLPARVRAHRAQADRAG